MGETGGWIYIWKAQAAQCSMQSAGKTTARPQFQWRNEGRAVGA